MNQQEKKTKINNDGDSNADNAELEILEQGDIYFFYRPKKNSQEVKGIEDVRRFFMVTSPETDSNTNSKKSGSRSKVEENQFYRLFVIGKKSLPEIRKSEARSSERYWARVGGIFEDKNELTKELFSDEFRKGDTARPVGAGKYVIVRHQNHAEIAYILETPEKPGEAQQELGIEKEASYIISVINPKQPSPSGYPSAEESPNYPEEVLKEFDKNENFVSLAKDTKLINYQNAQIILIGAREGKDTISKEFGLEIGAEEEGKRKSSDVFNRLSIRKGEVPTRPLIEGKLE
ncbi:MAG: hypothetical protein M3M88_06950 [Thermoproteota archaeon]|nr:hypothetical protein [Thermoproteota archaeon]